MKLHESQVAHESIEVMEPQESAENVESTVRYATLVERADTIRMLICDGTLDPWEGLELIVAPSAKLVEVQRARWRADAAHARRRFSPEARARALALVAGGASLRVAAAAALGDERYRMNVWRWVRQEQERA